MKRFVLVMCVFAALVGTASSTTLFTTTNSGFTDQINWCQYGCPGGGTLPTPQAFTSVGGQTGLAGVPWIGDPFYVLQQGSNWFGNFDAGMGVLYNGNLLNGGIGNLGIEPNGTIYGIGAYIQADRFGAFTGYMNVYDTTLNLVATFSAAGLSNGVPGSALFMGVFSDIPIGFAEWWVSDINGINSVGMGTAYLSETPVPEPSSLLLLGTGLIGAAGAIRRKLS